MKLAMGGGEHSRAPPPLPSHSLPQTGSRSCCKASCPSLRQVLAEFALPPSLGELLHPLSTWQAAAESALLLPLLAAPRYLGAWLSPDGTGLPAWAWAPQGDVSGKGCIREQGELRAQRANTAAAAAAWEAGPP